MYSSLKSVYMMIRPAGQLSVDAGAASRKSSKSGGGGKKEKGRSRGKGRGGSKRDRKKV